MRSKQCRCHPCSSHRRTRLLGHCKLLHRFCIQALLCCAAADDWKVASSHQAVGLTIRKGVAPMASVLVSNSTTDNATSPLEMRLRHSEARTEVAEEQEELEKQLLVNALAKAKKAEATVQQEKLQVSSEGKAAKRANQSQHDTEEKLQQALSSLQQSQHNQKTLEEKEEEDLDRAKSLEEKVVKVRQELQLEKKNSSRAVTNASEEGQKANRLRHQVLKLAKELADAKKEAEEEEKKVEDAKNRFSQEEHKAKRALINQTQETAAAQKEAQKAEDAQNKAEKQLHTLEVALQDARRQWHFAEKNATKVMEEKATAEEELRHSRIEAKADAQHLLSAEANASKAHHLTDLAKTELQEEEHHAKETIDRANSKARAAEKHLIIQRHKLQVKEQLVDAMMANTTDLKKKLEQAKNATKQEATKNQVLTKELHSAHVAIGRVKADEETAENQSAALELQKDQALRREQAMKQKAATTTEWARAAVANATKAAHKEMQAEEHHMKVAIENISTLRQEVQNLTASKWEAEKQAKDSKIAADNATKEEHEALTAKNRAEDRQKKLLKSLQHVESKLLDARHAMTKGNQSKHVAEKGMREEKLEIAHLNQSLEFMRQREEKEKRLLHLAQQRTHKAQQEAEFAKQNVTKEEEAARHREAWLEKKLDNATVALQKAQTTKTAAEAQMRILNLTVRKEQARFQAEVRSDTEAKENATKLAEAVARMRKQSGFATAVRENLTSQLQAAQETLRELKTSKGKLIEEDGKEMKQLKDKLALFRRKEAEDQQAAKQAAKRAGEALHEAREGGQNVTAVASNAEVAKLTEKLLQLRREASEEKQKVTEEMAKEKDRASAKAHEAKALQEAKMEESRERAALANATFEMEAKERQVASLQRSLRGAKEKEEKLLPLILCLLLGFALTVGLLRRHFLAQRARQFETILRLSVERLKALKMLEDATVPLLSNGSQAAKDQLDE